MKKLLLLPILAFLPSLALASGIYNPGSSGGGGGGSSTLAIGTGTASSFVKIITSPTANISVLPSQFNLTTSGTTSFWQLNGSSVTLLGPKIGLTNEVEGILPVANGGTESSTASGALSNLLTSLTFTPPTNLNLDYMSYYDSGVLQTYSTSLQQMADVILPTFSGIWDLSQGGTGFDNAVDAMGNFISSLGVPAFPSDGSISYFPYYNGFEGVAHSVTADSLASFVGNSLSTQTIHNQFASVQNATFSIHRGLFDETIGIGTNTPRAPIHVAASQNEMFRFERDFVGSDRSALIGLYQTGSLNESYEFGYYGTNGAGFGSKSHFRFVVPISFNGDSYGQGLRLYDHAGGNYMVVAQASGTVTSSMTVILPSVAGTVGQVRTISNVTTDNGATYIYENWQTPSAGGGGSSTLAVSSNNVIVSSPTGNLNFMPPFIVALQGSTSAQVTLNSSSVTLQGVINPIYNQPTLQSGATAYPSFVYVGSSATISGDLAIGTLASASVAAPRYIDLGGTFSSSAGSAPKLKLYNDGVSVVGFGISSSQMDYIVPSAFSHDWYIGGTQKMALDTNGITVLGNGQFGTNTAAATATPLTVSFGGTYGNSTAGSTANLKWLMYYNTGDGNKYGIGMSSGLMEYQAGTIGGHGFYVDAGTLAMYINGGAAGTKGYIAMNATNNAAAKLHIQPAAATDIATIIQGQTGQSADLLQLRDSNSVILATFTSSGNLKLPQLSASTVTIGSPLALPNTPLNVGQNANNAVAIAVQNSNAGSLASSDFIATNDLGSNTSFYLDLGINSSTNSDTNFSVFKASDSYLYAANRSLDIGTAENVAGSSITFFTGGTSTTNVRLGITNTGTLYVPTLIPGPMKIIATSSNVVVAAISLSSASDVTGTLQAAQFPALTGQVTTSVGSLATTVQPISLSTGITGIVQPANMVSTVAYTTDNSTGSFTFSIATGSWNSLVIPGCMLHWVSGSTVTAVFAETMPLGSTVTFSLEKRNFGLLNSAGTAMFNVTYSTGNSDGILISSFVAGGALVAAKQSVDIVTAAAGAASGSPTNLKVTVWYLKPRN